MVNLQYQKLLHFRHRHTRVGVLSGWDLSIIQSYEEPCVDRQESRIRAVSWHERTQHVSRDEPSAPGKLTDKPSAVRFHYKQCTQKTAYCVHWTIVSLTLRDQSQGVHLRGFR